MRVFAKAQHLTVKHAVATVQIPREDRRPMAAYFVAPQAQAHRPAVVVIHEVFGLNDPIRRVASRFADEGYSALAVDLFSGGNRGLCLLRVMGGMMLRPLNNSGLRDLRASIEWLGQRPEVNASRIGVIGFCMGGGYAAALACVDDDVKAASIFYGMNPRPMSAFSDACPIVGSYPEKDFTRNAGVALERELTSRHIPHDIKIYPGARHSFFNEDGKTYDAAAATDSWRRTLDFFAAHL
jgi:carboxymethylenebutenolidase